MRKVLSFLLCVMLLAFPCAFAEGAEEEEAPKEPLDSAALDEMIAETLKELGIKPEKVSVALRDTASGEYYYYNADRWVYTASLYKLPVVMTYANMLNNGEAEPDSFSRTDDEIFEKVLEYSDYPWVTKLETAIYGAKNYMPGLRKQDLEYAHFNEEELPASYFKQSAYSARFFLGVIEELYEHSEEYPNVLEHMKLANPTKYFHRNLGDKYEIAQKYGSDQQCVHAAGIIYTEQPILLVIMTKDQSDMLGNRIIGTLSERITEILSAE